MLTPRENAMAIFEHRQPDCYNDMMASIKMVPDPMSLALIFPKDGKEYKDNWGTTYIFRQDQPAKYPHITKENTVLKDIENWKNEVVIPPAVGLDWSRAEAFEKTVDRDAYFVGVACPTGLFERTHYLMGFEEALMAFMEYPDKIAELLRAIADHKIAYIHEMAKHVHPDIIFFQDDWGSKQSVFLPPRVWRELIKPLQKEISNAIHECGMIYMHHADCVCQPLVEDMVEIGVDVWQGVIPQNDILEIQRITQGKLPMIGGIDGAALDRAEVTEEEIRAHVRMAIDKYCAAGRFYPSGRLFLKRNNDIVLDEVDKYGAEYAKTHPIV